MRFFCWALLLVIACSPGDDQRRGKQTAAKEEPARAAARLPIFELAAQAAGDPLTIVYASNFEAEVAGRSAPTRTLGGLATKVRWIQELQRDEPEAKNLLLFDAGDIFADDRKPTHEQRNHIAQSYQSLGYHALALGERDLLLGVQDYLRLIQEFRLPVLCHNLRKKSGNPFTPSFVHQVQGHQIGIMGVTSDKLLKRYQVPIKKAGFEILPMASSAAAEARRLKQQGAQLVIALVHAPWKELQQLLKEVDGIDIIIGGHDYFRPQIPEHHGQRYLLASGNRGLDLGLAQLVLRPQAQGIHETATYLSKHQLLGDLQASLKKKSNSLNTKILQGRIATLEPQVAALRADLGLKEYKEKHLLFNTQISLEERR